MERTRYALRNYCGDVAAKLSERGCGSLAAQDCRSRTGRVATIAHLSAVGLG
jgi:hypothetical protein